MKTIIIDDIYTIQFTDIGKLSFLSAKVKGENKYTSFELWDAEKFFSNNFENEKVKFQKGRGRTTLKSLIRYIENNTYTASTFFIDGNFSMEYRDGAVCHTEIVRSEEEFLQLKSEGFCRQGCPNFKILVDYAMI